MVRLGKVDGDIYQDSSCMQLFSSAFWSTRFRGISGRTVFRNTATFEDSGMSLPLIRAHGGGAAVLLKIRATVSSKSAHVHTLPVFVVLNYPREDGW